jgi:hypothetical protein
MAFVVDISKLKYFADPFGKRATRDPSTEIFESKSPNHASGAVTSLLK